jgi:hypothetical protein
MTTGADIGFVEMRLGKVVGVSTAQDHPSFCVVLDAVSEDRRLPIQIGQTEAFNLSATARVPGPEEFGPPRRSNLRWADVRHLSAVVQWLGSSTRTTRPGVSCVASTSSVMLDTCGMPRRKTLIA